MRFIPECMLWRCGCILAFLLFYVKLSLALTSINGLWQCCFRALLCLIPWLKMLCGCHTDCSICAAPLFLWYLIFGLLLGRFKILKNRFVLSLLMCKCPFFIFFLATILLVVCTSGDNGGANTFGMVYNSSGIAAFLIHRHFGVPWPNEVSRM